MSAWRNPEALPMWLSVTPSRSTTTRAARDGEGPACCSPIATRTSRSGAAESSRQSSREWRSSCSPLTAPPPGPCCRHSFRDCGRSRCAPRWSPLTVGGNDLLAAYGDTGAARKVIAGVETVVDTGLAELTGVRAPTAGIVVGTVYDPSDGTGDAARLGLPPWPDAVAVIEELNDTLRAV